MTGREMARSAVTVALEYGPPVDAYQVLAADQGLAAEAIAELVDTCVQLLTALAGQGNPELRERALSGSLDLGDVAASRVAAQALWGRYCAALAAVEDA